jgi:hypothetical protein
MEYPVCVAATPIAQQAIDTAKAVKDRLIGLWGDARHTIPANPRRMAAATRVK